jgi:hypothetical protein
MCFIKEYNMPLYLTDTVVLQNLNTIVFNIDTKDEVTMYYQSELDIIQILLDNDQLWLDVVQEELSLSMDDYLLSVPDVSQA